MRNSETRFSIKFCNPTPRIGQIGEELKLKTEGKP